MSKHQDALSSLLLSDIVFPCLTLGMSQKHGSPEAMKIFKCKD